MIELTLREVVEIVGGTLGGGAHPTVLVTGSVEFDSRQIEPGGLFLALAGEHVDGHDFVERAIAAGAVAAITTRPVDAAHIQVKDSLIALADLARAVLRRLPDLTVIGITGSSGKTSTKDLLAQVLATLGPTVAPPGSFNNELGHPYTVLRATPQTRFLVTETSARGLGHIRYLTEIAPPRIGVVLNVGSAHLGEFGSRAAIAIAKGELVEALPAAGADAGAGGVAVLNGDDPLVRAMAERTSARVVLVGRSPDCSVRATGVTMDQLGRASFTLEASASPTSAAVTLQLSGEHHVANALAVAAVGLECGLSINGVAAALSNAVAVSSWRMQITERADGVIVINDAYNANPESMQAALETLRTVGNAHPGARTWAVLGPMAELGPDADTAHRELGKLVARLGLARLVVVGSAARPIVDGAVLEGWAAGEPDWVADTEAAIRLVAAQLRDGDVVLVKASRAAGLEQVALALVNRAAGNRGEQA